VVPLLLTFSDPEVNMPRSRTPTPPKATRR